MAELMQVYYDENIKKFEGVISAISSARVVLNELCPQTKYAGDGIWEKILIEIVRMEIDEKLNKPTTNKEWETE